MKKLYLIFIISFVFSINNSKAQIYGCTDQLATNYDFSATDNDGSCIYNSASISPVSSFNLDSNIIETSGLVKWNNQIWTHNDNSDINIYSLDTSNGNIIQSYALSGVVNRDWEDISQDNDYIYIGDFGNNSSGNRTDLKILRIDKNSLILNSPIIDTINFLYSDQIDFSAAEANNTDFDCEAFIVSADSIFLFSKQWVSNKTSVYSLPKVPGSYIAKLKHSYNVNGLITGAVYLEPKKLVALCGYSSLLQPFVYLLYDFKGNDYFSGNKRKISISLPFHQVEGIATTDGLKFYISNEYFTKSFLINIPQKLHILDLSTLLGDYLNNILSVSEFTKSNYVLIFPNPANNIVTIKTNNVIFPSNYFFENQAGQIVLKGKLTKNNQNINISDLSSGAYILKIGEENKASFKVIKR
ncbi:MAG: T9SS type A sorting domain-containing protein [Bacteroidetes bacterium]|nr:T9SS type A sorting domain-containing protein [Bacteroidota bacterium]